MPITVLIVDDHAAFRSSARAALQLDGFDVVGEAHDGQSALERARQLDPDLILLDVALPDLSGFDVAESLSGCRSKVILISSREQRDLGRRVLRSHALGFVSKDRLSGDIISALLRCAR